MSENKVKCEVLGHSDGPACDRCGLPMDSILVHESKVKTYKAHYCWRCTKPRGA